MKHLIALAVLAFFIGSCNKKEIPRPNTIQVGLESDMLVTHYNKKLLATTEAEVFDIDLDQDGSYDVRFDSKKILVDGLGICPEIYLKCLKPNVRILSNVQEDTTYIHQDFQFTTDPNGNQMGINWTTRACRKLSPAYDLDTVTIGFSLQPKMFKDVLDSEDLGFRSLDLALSIPSERTFEPTGDSIMGIPTYNLNQYIHDCIDFSTEHSIYVGVQMITETGSRLGWIRIGISSEQNIHIYSWALQI
jgi:hypothetical protein